MKSKAVLLMGLAGMIAMGDLSYPQRETQPNPKLTDEERKRDKERYKNLLLKRGVKEFIINDKVYLARSFESALRKSKRETK